MRVLGNKLILPIINNLDIKTNRAGSFLAKLFKKVSVLKVIEPGVYEEYDHEQRMFEVMKRGNDEKRIL